MFKFLIRTIFCGVIFCLGMPSVTAFAAEEAHEESGEDGGDVEKLSQPIFAEIGHIMLPIFGDGAPKQILVIKITLEVENTADKDIILMYEPRLRNAYLQRIYGKIEIDPTSYKRPVDIDLLHKVIKEETHKILGKDFNVKVLVPGLSQQKA